MEIRLVGAVLMHADRWTDGHDRALYYYANVPNNDTMKYCNPRSVPPPKKKLPYVIFRAVFMYTITICSELPLLCQCVTQTSTKGSSYTNTCTYSAPVVLPFLVHNCFIS